MILLSTSRRPVILLALLAASACSKDKPLSDTDDGGLDVLRTQAMVPGESLGAIRLGEMTISTFVAGSRATSDLESYRLEGLWIEYQKSGQTVDGAPPVVRSITIFRPADTP